jgi:hypothetical protein
MAVTLNASTSSGFIQSADTSGEINLQSNGSTKLSVLSTGVSGTLFQGTAVTAATGSPTSIDFTSIPSWVKRVTVMCAGMSYNATATPMIQLGTSGGIDSTSNYVGSSVSLVTGTTTESALNTVGFNIGPSSVAAVVFNLTVTLSLLNASTNQWICAVSGGASNTAVGYAGGGNKTLTGTLDRVRITTLLGTATFDAGTINIQYEG